MIYNVHNILVHNYMYVIYKQVQTFFGVGWGGAQKCFAGRGV